MLPSRETRAWGRGGGTLQRDQGLGGVGAGVQAREHSCRAAGLHPRPSPPWPDRPVPSSILEVPNFSCKRPKSNKSFRLCRPYIASVSLSLFFNNPLKM